MSPDRNSHVKLRALQDFLQDAQRYNSEPRRTPPEDIYWIVQLPQKSEDLKNKLNLITTNNQVLELKLGIKIPALQMDPKSQMRRQRRMKSPEYRVRDSGNLLYQTLAAKWSSCMVPHHASMRLTPYWSSGFEGAQDAHRFDMLLSTHSEPSSWQETMFVIDKRLASP